MRELHLEMHIVTANRSSQWTSIGSTSTVELGTEADLIYYLKTSVENEEFRRTRREIKADREYRIVYR